MDISIAVTLLGSLMPVKILKFPDDVVHAVYAKKCKVSMIEPGSRRLAMYSKYQSMLTNICYQQIQNRNDHVIGQILLVPPRKDDV